MPYQYRNQHTGMSHHETAHASAGIVFLFYIALFAFIGTINGLLELIIAGAAIAAIEYIIQNFLGFPDGILLIALYSGFYLCFNVLMVFCCNIHAFKKRHSINSIRINPFTF